MRPACEFSRNYTGLYQVWGEYPIGIALKKARILAAMVGKPFFIFGFFLWSRWKMVRKCATNRASRLTR